MFFHIVLERTMLLHPRSFGPKLRDTLTQQLLQDVEGRCDGKNGFIVAVTNVHPKGAGEITSGTGMVKFPVSYHALVFRPFKGEVLECVVTQVFKMGFFAEAGPLQVFVSNHLIPDDLSFDSTQEPCFKSDTGEWRIQKETEVRLKIVGMRIDATSISAIGTIKDDFLGEIRDDPTGT